jgi:hypothetical protein
MNTSLDLYFYILGLYTGEFLFIFLIIGRSDNDLKKEAETSSHIILYVLHHDIIAIIHIYIYIYTYIYIHIYAYLSILRIVDHI